MSQLLTVFRSVTGSPVTYFLVGQMVLCCVQHSEATFRKKCLLYSSSSLVTRPCPAFHRLQFAPRENLGTRLQQQTILKGQLAKRSELAIHAMVPATHKLALYNSPTHQRSVIETSKLFGALLSIMYRGVQLATYVFDSLIQSIHCYMNMSLEVYRYLHHSHCCNHHCIWL